MDDSEVNEIVEGLRGKHDREMVDTVVTLVVKLTDRAWRRVWMIGFAAGMGGAIAGRALLEWVGLM